jgi:hypothetical protein
VTKDSRLTFRVATSLKKKIEELAAREGRSTAQICEAFLRSGLEHYQREGNKAFQKFFGLAGRTNLTDK